MVGPSGFEPLFTLRPPAYQTGALTGLSYGPTYFIAEAGFEPAASVKKLQLMRLAT